MPALAECLGGVVVVFVASVFLLAALGEILDTPGDRQFVVEAMFAVWTGPGLFFLACFAVLGASLSFLVVYSFFPPNARLTLAWRLSTWTTAVLVTVAMYVGAAWALWWVLYGRLHLV